MHGEYKVPGGKLVVVDLDVDQGRLANVKISGDFFLEPDSALDDMTAALEGIAENSDEASIAAIVQDAAGAAELLGITPDGVAVAVKRALAEVNE